MFSIKLTARPDARMVEVPLDIEVELPREFEGTAVLVSSGMPRKLRLRAPKDLVKLSTAYRIDQLVADLVRQLLRGQPVDVAKAQEAAAGFLKTARERRQDGAVFLVESDGRGRTEIHQPPPVPAAPQRPAGAHAAQPPGTLTERIAALERGLAALEARLGSAPPEKLVRAVGEQLERRLEKRVAEFEEHLAALQRGEPSGRAAVRTSSALPTPGTARAGIRRATAVEAFAEGLRIELRLRAKGLLQAAQERSGLLDKAAQLAADAERTGSPRVEAAEALQRIAAEASARTSAISRILEEVDFYPASDVPVAGQLLERLERADPTEPLPLLRAVVEAAFRAGTLQLAWLQRAAQLAGWSVIAPAPGDRFDPLQHELAGPRGEVIDALVLPGVRDPHSGLLLHARVRARTGRDAARTVDEDLPLVDLETELETEVAQTFADVSMPPPEGTRPLTDDSKPIERTPPGTPPLPDAESLRAQLQALDPARVEHSPAAEEAENELLAEITSGQILSAPIVSGEIVSGEIVSDPIVSAPLPSEPVSSGRILPDLPFQSGQDDDEWDRVGQGSSAFQSDKGKEPKS